MSSLLFLVAYVLIAVQENIKDVIAHIMLNYEDRIQELSETRFCGQCFKGFIRRYEMNIHPPPLEVEEKLPPQYVFPPLISSDMPGDIFSPSSQPMEMRRVDVDEESYFNGDDGDDEDDSATPGPHPAPTSPLPPLLTPPLSRFQFGQKRRRQRAPGIPLRTSLGGITQQQRAPTPATPIHLPRTPPISALVDYGDDDEQSSDPDDALLESLVSSKPPASAVAAAGTTISTTSTLSSPISPTTVGTTSGSGGFVPLRAEKRRRAEEDEDEMGLERLVGGKSKRPTKSGTTGGSEEGPKRIRLRFGAASLAAASSTPPTAARSGSGAKDGDTG
jgi:protein phosphatase 4 regulatory subunit 3